MHTYMHRHLHMYTHIHTHTHTFCPNFKMASSPSHLEDSLSDCLEAVLDVPVALQYGEVCGSGVVLYLPSLLACLKVPLSACAHSYVRPFQLRNSVKKEGCQQECRL